MKSPLPTCPRVLFLPSFMVGFVSIVLSVQGQVTISGELKKWHKVTLTIDGTNTGEAAALNPFTDCRLNITFSNEAKTYVVPGFYAADGNAAESGATTGDKWRVHFTPDEAGTWHYSVSFRTGAYITVSNDSGVALPSDGITGSFFVEPSNKTGNDLRAKGMLRYTGLHHLQFAETGEYFLKGGTNSPENFLAYHEFDQTIDIGGVNDNTLVNGLHQYAAHVQHWQAGDPVWQNGKGKGIIGALNYLAAQHINSVYFLTYTIDGGDGRDTWVWTSPGERERFDCSKLDQWEIVFSHMDSLGIQLHLIMQEQENDQSLGDSVQQLTNIRKLYYRELIARFSHHLALQWNIGEENTNTNAERAAFAQYISNLDPYQHPIAIHTPNLVTSTYYDSIFATPSYLQYFEAASLQGVASSYNNWAISLRNKSSVAGRKWAIYGDEQIPSVAPDGSDFDVLRRDALWGNLMGGGAGVEWYFGYQDSFGDIQTEDFTVVQTLWQYTHYALDFFQSHLPFHQMTPRNDLLVNRSDDDVCLALEGLVYAVYFETGGSAATRLSIQQPGNYIVKWYNPRTGGALQDGSIATIAVSTSGNFYLGLPPVAEASDWVALVTNNVPAMEIAMLKNDVTCYGINSGEAEAVVSGGVLPYTYQWSNGANTSSINQLVPGLYAVTVADAFLNTISDAITILQPSALNATSAVVLNNGFGEIALDITGGTLPYSCSWSSGQKTSSIDSLNSGVYCVTVTDGYGCSTALCDTIVIPQCDVPPFTCTDHDPCTIDTCSGSACVSTPIVCDDANVCTSDACNDGQCEYTQITCDDADACTLNDCDSASNCYFTPIVCNDDGDLCTTETCMSGPCVSSAILCDDQNPCTSDLCENGNCISVAILCDDNVACTIDSCINGVCIFIAADCNDNDLCTIDNCDTTGQCIYTTVNCDDNIACTSNHCSQLSGCIFTEIICSADNDLCTLESCVNGQCISASIICNDGNSCTADECSQGQCDYTSIICNDNNACTIDNCMDGQCVFTNIICTDNNLCTNDNCENGSCVYAPVVCTDDGNACTIEACISGNCTSTAIICNDNIACTNDACQNGNCVFTPVVCTDNNPCTTDNCVNGQCAFTNLICSDNNLCTTDACQNGQCVFTPVVCNDDNVCTNDVCSSGQCAYPPLPLQVVSLTLVNSATDVDIRNLKESDTVNLAVTPNVNIRGNVCSSAKSIRFVLNGSTFKTESSIPFSLAGDNSGNYNKWNVSVGLYTITATPYTGTNAGGTAGIAKTISLRVINHVAPACVSDANCNDNNACTNNICQSGQCVFPAINCNDNNPCTDDACNNGICTNSAIICNDNNLCTSDACVNGICVYTPQNCNDNNACTTDGCSAGNCIYSTRNCNDNNTCTTDGCNSATGCTNIATPNCCATAADCNDNNPCTIDACNNKSCQYAQGGNDPSYLRIVNPAKSWRKLKLAYSTSSFYSPRYNVTTTGNDKMCITLRSAGTPEWNKIQIRPQGSSGASVPLSNYISGSAPNWTTICIPLSAFSGYNFTNLSFLEIPYSNGAIAFEIHLQKVVFTGGSVPFLWFGENKTDNLHDGQSGSGSALMATLLQGNPCASKTDGFETQFLPQETNLHLNAYPNPFTNKLNIEFSLPSASHARLEIFNASGQLLHVLFDGTVTSGTLERFEYVADHLPGGVIIYKLQTPESVHYGKAVMLR